MPEFKAYRRDPWQEAVLPSRGQATLSGALNYTTSAAPVTSNSYNIGSFTTN